MRPQQQWHDDDQADVHALDAAYGFGLVKNRPVYRRQQAHGFLAMVTCQGLNGYELTAADDEVVGEIVALAARIVSENGLADWIREHSIKR